MKIKKTSSAFLKQNVLVIVAVVAISLAGYFYYQLQNAKQDSQADNKKEIASLVDKVSKLIILPTDETPTVATVSDPSALKDQPFFDQAVKGDKVLIYAQAKKAILYSVSLNKILDVAPLNIDSKSTSAPQNTAQKSGTVSSSTTSSKN